MVDESLYAYMRLQLELTCSDFHRYLYNDVNWNARMIAITGARGVGKSTMVLQYVKTQISDCKVLYISADHTFFTTHTLVEVADDFSKEAGSLLVIDEVHKYPDWSRELKQIYDTHPDMKVIFTGSSVLDIIDGVADLSRRVLHYTMYGLSFREYLGLFHHISVPKYSLEEILDGKAHIEGMLHPLPAFREYLSEGYYPFAIEGDFPLRMQNVITKTIESDIAQYAGLRATTAKKLKKMLAVISGLAPYKPNADNLALEIGISRNSVQDYLSLLERAQLIGQLRDDTGGIRGLGKVEKVYIDNPSLMRVLSGGKTDVGNMRETFFYNQMRVKNDVISSRQSDFKIEKYTFEVGGRKKGKKQIEDIPDSFIVKDDIEFAQGNVIPLWAFGLNY
ncbi:MAG: AAA family ATPase [Candidatus Cryptobacteroides sp.]|nr:AAA family ATPase [Bacteroidales bacterium]MDY2774815.1 AAA family ATPase [Candidatus Cryptobacteroides sp.]